MKTAKRFLALVLTLALCLVPMGMTTYAAATIRIYVIDENNNPLEYALYYLYVKDQSGNWQYVESSDSDSNGTIGFALEDGEYMLVEQYPPLGSTSKPDPIYLSIDNGVANIDEIVYELLPDLGIPVLHIPNIDLGTQVFGATPQTTGVDIRSIGDGNASSVEITLSGVDASAFTVLPTSFSSIQARQAGVITITPAANLSAGSYSAQLTVKYKDDSDVDYRTDAIITYTVLPITHTITATAGTGGGIDPNGTVTVNDGDNQTFTITADADYKISDVEVDGDSKGAIDTYTFENVTQLHTIHAEFVYTGTGGTTGTTGSTGTTATTSGSRSSSGGSGGTTATPSTSKNTDTPQQIGDYSWRVDLPVLGFMEASVDGVPLVRGEDCIVKSGSTILTLTDSYVNTLRSGTHTLRMEFLSATATIDFTVTPTGTGGDVGEPNAPALTNSTNDTMNPSTGGVEAAGSIAVLLAVVGLWAVAPRKMGK